MRIKRVIGIFGVTANPPHCGHIQAIENALLQCNEVWVSPVYKHPFEKKSIDYEHRLEMLNMILPAKKGIYLTELDKEYYFTHHQIPYSYELLKHTKKHYPSSMPKLIVGQDNKKPEVWHKFYEHDKIDAEFGVITIKDEGIHSTAIRQFCMNQQWHEVLKYCGPEVTQYIIDHEFYKDGV